MGSGDGAGRTNCCSNGRTRRPPTRTHQHPRSRPMRVAIYVRVSTQRQAQTQTIDQQLDRLRAVAADRGWVLSDDHVFRDDGYSGASLRRPGLDKLRDLAALARFDVILVTDPDRLARNYVHQVLLLRSEEHTS